MIKHLDAERIARAIELTRFPVPEGDDYSETGSEPALVRAADLIGQLGDPNHARKLNALYWEFVEIGMAAQLGYQSPADLAEQYPQVLLVQGRALSHHRARASGTDRGRQAVDRPALRPRLRRGAQAAAARAGAGDGGRLAAATKR